MTKIRWHKRSETKAREDRTKQDVSIFSVKDSTQYQSFVHKNVQLCAAKSAIHSLKSHLSQDTSKETGGILVGNVSIDSKKDNLYTEITGAIAAPTTIGNRSTFRFTPHCWTAIIKKQKEFYPQTQIVGWYHSHPNFGVFLSGVDLETQQDCFNQPWHIAVVYDPIRDEIGFFCGATGEKMKPVTPKNKSRALASTSLHNRPVQPTQNPQNINADEDEPEARSSQENMNGASSTENPEDINADEDEPETSSSQENTNLLSALKGIFIGFKSLVSNLILLFFIIIKGLVWIVISLLKIFEALINAVFKLFLKWFNKK